MSFNDRKQESELSEPIRYAKVIDIRSRTAHEVFTFYVQRLDKQGQFVKNIGSCVIEASDKLQAEALIAKRLNIKLHLLRFKFHSWIDTQGEYHRNEAA